MRLAFHVTPRGCGRAVRSLAVIRPRLALRLTPDAPLVGGVPGFRASKTVALARSGRRRVLDVIKTGR